MDNVNVKNESGHLKDHPKNIVEFVKELKRLNVPEKEYGKRVERFLEFKARKMRIPIHGTFELTPLCNFDCKMCYVHLKPFQFNQNQLLPVQSWKKLIKEAHESGMINASLSGGECLTYPGFDEVYLFLWQLGIKCAIMSNGYFMNRERILFFQKYPPRKIQITLYGSSDDAYEKVTGHRAFQTVYENILMLRDSNFNISVGITPNGYMKGDLISVIDTVTDIGVPYHINAGLITPRNNTGREKKDATTEQYIQMLQYADSIKHLEHASIDLTELPEENHDGNKRFGLRCGGARSGFTVKYDGNMSPCAALDNISSKPLENGFLNAWKELVEKADQYPLPEECGGCVYEKSCLHCVAMHREAPVFGHCDPRICERTKRMVSAGVLSLPSKK